MRACGPLVSTRGTRNARELWTYTAASEQHFTATTSVSRVWQQRERLLLKKSLYLSVTDHALSNTRRRPR